MNQGGPSYADVFPPLAGLWDTLERSLGDAQDSPLAVVVILVGLAIGFALAWWWAMRDASARPAKPNPALLFEELVQAHKLPGHERRLVRSVAQSAGTTRPADVFVRSEAWDQYVVEDEQTAASVQALRRRLCEAPADAL
jgi:hypothetical protein